MKHLIAAVALSSLVGCAGYYSADYHPTSAHPPTPTAREAYDACHGAMMNQFTGEETAAYAVGGMIGELASGVVDRRRAAFLSCMEAHGYAKNS